MRMLFLLCALLTSSASGCAADRTPARANDFFGLTNLWTFELRLPRDAWSDLSSGSSPFNPSSSSSASDSVRAALTIDGVQYPNVTLRLKGGGTRGGAGQGRPPLRLVFPDKNAFPVHELSLNNNFFDSSFMRDALSYKLFNDFGVPAPKTAHVKLYVTFSDSGSRRFVGLYTASEVVDAQFLQAHFADSSGLLLKPELGHQGFPPVRSWEDHQQSLAPKNAPTPAQKERMLAFMRLIHESDDATFRQQIASFMDTDNYLRFLVVTVALANLDSYLGMGKNFYLYAHPRTGKLHWIPWDHDLSFGGFFLCGTPEERMTLSINSPSSINDRLLQRILAMAEIKKQYRELLRDFLAKHFQPETLNHQIDQLAAILQPAILEEKRRSLAAFQRSTDGRPARSEPSEPSRLSRHELGSPWSGGILEPGLKSFIERRHESIHSQLDGKSRGARPHFGR